MPAVKPLPEPEPARRRYVSAVRRATAESTRLAVLEAARKLFVEQGYGATTVDQVAERAGVSKPTVFAAVGSKSTLLKVVRDVALAGDDEPGPVVERPWYREMLAAPDPRRMLRLHARNCTRMNRRYAAVDEVLHAAAGSDSELRALWEASQQERRFGAAYVVDHLRRKGPLRKTLTRDLAVDLMWLLMAPDVYHRLCTGAGWRDDRFERWLAGTMTQQLLG